MAYSVFIDQCILSDSDILVVEKRNNIIGYTRKPPPGKIGDWKRNEFNCLPTISKLVKDKKLSLYRYIELEIEKWKSSGSFPANTLGRLFKISEMETVASAIDRSYFFQSSLGDHVKKDNVIDFCKWLNIPNLEKSILNSNLIEILPQNMLENIKNLQRYRELCNGISESQYIDAFHLWSAEVNGIDFFLTTDKKFVNVMKKTKRIG